MGRSRGRKTEGMTFEKEAHVKLNSRSRVFLKLTDSYLFIPSHFKCVYRQLPAFLESNLTTFFHKKHCLKKKINKKKAWENMLFPQPYTN